MRLVQTHPLVNSDNLLVNESVVIVLVKEDRLKPATSGSQASWLWSSQVSADERRFALWHSHAGLHTAYNISLLF